MAKKKMPNQRTQKRSEKPRKQVNSRMRASVTKRARTRRNEEETDQIPQGTFPTGQPTDTSRFDASGLESFAQMLQFADTEVRLGSLAESHPSVKESLSNSSQVETAAIFGAMLLDERLQSNCGRLESLVNLAVAVGSGSTLTSQGKLADCFNELGDGICGRMDDPAEDVFVSLVTTRRGHFRVLEGIWESGAFFLQRVLDIVESLPDDDSFAVLRERVFALLVLSEAICERAGLARYTVGATTPRAKIDPSLCSKANRKIVLFSCAELENLGLTRDDLDIFTFENELLPHVASAPITNSPLQRFPIMELGDRVALVLPTAVSFAIRTAVVEFLIDRGFIKSLQTNLARQYATFFHSTNLFGSLRRLPIFFSDKEALPIAECIAEVDEGRYFHFLFFTDTLDHFYKTGLAGVDPGPAQHIDLLETRIRAAVDHAKKQPGYRNGVTLLVHCGIGRGTYVPVPDIGHEDWNIEFLSAPDLCTLSCTSKFTALKLWRTLEGVKRLTDLGVQIHNHNGLLNLIAWIDANDGHLISHSQVPQGFRNSQAGLFVATNFVLDLRRNVATENDVHCLPAVDGKMEIVRRAQDSSFPEDNDLPIYAVEHFSAENGLPFAYLSGRRTWWCHVVPSPDGEGDYDRWLMLKTWLPKIVRALEPVLGKELEDTVLLRVDFQKTTGDARQSAPVPTRDQIAPSYSLNVDTHASVVSVHMGEKFDLGLAHPTNVAERVLVVAICNGFAELANASLTVKELSGLESRIVVGDDARQIHVFHGRTYRDYMRHDLGHDSIELDDRDVADVRAGLAFRVESRDNGRASLRTKRTCTELLNSIVRDLEHEICDEIRLFDRAAFIELSLRNHEKAIIDRDRWTQTARANLALHDDKESALNVIAEHDMRLNSVLFPSRVLIEFAVCECPTEGGIRPGHLDFSKLMAKVNAIWQLGGWSHAIHLDTMPPNLTITPLGDVQAITDFESNVLMPFSKKGSYDRIATAVDDYAENFQPPNVHDTNESVLESEFEDAWNEEFGFGVNALREFMDNVEDVGITRKTAVFRIKRSELMAWVRPTLLPDKIDGILDAFTLHPRESWHTIPEGFDEKDIQPWRFRRQLSAIRRPIIQLDASDDPELIVAPGAIRECVAYVVRGYYEGIYPAQYRDANRKTRPRFSKKMRRWFGSRANNRGSIFVRRVVGRIKELGWHVAKPEINVTELLGIGTDPEYGDVSDYGDIDVLTWNENAKRLLVIECKHLHFHKTPGEIAEQLSDYHGRMKRDGKPDDLLRHLNRLDILNARKRALCRALGIDDDYRLEGWIFFKNPVPMLYTWKEFETRVEIATFENIERVLDKCC